MAANLAGYRVYYGTTSRSYFQQAGKGANAGNTTSYTVTGLRNGSRYYFAATAYNDWGYETSYSDEIYKDIP